MKTKLNVHLLIRFLHDRNLLVLICWDNSPKIQTIFCESASLSKKSTCKLCRRNHINIWIQFCKHLNSPTIIVITFSQNKTGIRSYIITDKQNYSVNSITLSKQIHFSFPQTLIRGGLIQKIPAFFSLF